MANKNNWGGKRKGAGRPTKGELINIKQFLDDSIDVNLVTQKLLERIESGDQRAIELYFKYRAGLPTQQIDMNVTGEQDINIRLSNLVSFEDDDEDDEDY